MFSFFFLLLYIVYFCVTHIFQGVKHIEGIVLDLEEKQDKLKLQAGLFEDMTGLRILEIGNVEFCEDFTHLSKQLRLLNWHGYPSTCLPLQFESRYLFELLLPVGQNTQLWKGQKVSTYKNQSILQFCFFYKLYLPYKVLTFQKLHPTIL